MSRLRTVARVVATIASVLLLTHLLLRAWYWSMLDMHLYGVYSDLLDHGHAALVDDMEFITAAVLSLVVASGLVWGVVRAWSRLRA